MVYFFPGPLFLLWLVCAAFAVSLTATVPALKPYFPVAWRVAVWTTVGGLVANIVSNALAIWVIPMAQNSSVPADVYSMDRASPSVGQFLASAVCWLGGAAIGIALSRRKRGGLPPNTSLERTRER